jgi:periplasmic protein TonB
VDEEPPKDEPPPDAPPPISTGLTGPGPGLAGLGSGPSGGNGTGRIGGSGSRGSKYGLYLGKLQRSVLDALNREPSLKKLVFETELRVWADSTARITRAKLGKSTGNSAADDLVRNGSLIGLQLPEPPPADLPMPIVMRFTATRTAQVANR